MKKSIIKNEKSRSILHILSGITAVVSFVIFILLLLAELKIIPPKGASDNTQTTVSTDISIYETTEKNYTIFIDERYLYHSETNGVTTIRGKTDRSIKMEISPLLGTSYTALCNEASSYLTETEDYAPLNTANLYSVYSLTENDTVTIVYCVDDGVGSSIKIEYTHPESNAQAKETFEIMLSMFKLTSEQEYY